MPLDEHLLSGGFNLNTYFHFSFMILLQSSQTEVAKKAADEAAQATQEALKDITNLDFSNLSLNVITQYVTAFGMKLLAAAVVFFVARFLITHFVKVISKIMKRRGIEASLQTFTLSAISISLNLLLAIVTISILGIDTTTFVGILAGAGMAIGMALSGTLQNFAGGVMILLFKPYKVGHYITAQGYEGTVKEIQIFNTILTTIDNQTIIIPNGGLSTGCLKNYSKQPHRRVDIDVEVAYGTKVEDVRKVLNEIIEADSRILKSDPFMPATPMTSMASSSIIFQLRVWTESANYWPVRFDTTEAVYTQLNAAGIEIPFQQIDVHMRN